MVGTILATTASALGATGIPQAFIARRAGRRAEREQQRAQRTSEASAQVISARRRRQAIAQARIAQARNIAAQDVGVQTSALSGVQSGIASTLGANIAEQRANIQNQQAIFGFQQSAADILRRGQERAGLFTAAGQTGQAVVGALMGGTGSFGGPTTPSIVQETPNPLTPRVRVL